MRASRTPSVIRMMKPLALSVSFVFLCSCLGCNGGDARTSNGQPVGTSGAASSDQAKKSIQQGGENARITQQIMRTGHLPNGQPVPSASNPIMQPPGR